MDFDHPCLTIIERDFPVPEANSASRMRDKWGKLKVGLVAARGLAPAHVMFVDADDCVHNGLAAHVSRYPDAAGWSMDTGYVHDEGSCLVYRKKKFFKVCGSSAIIRLSEQDFPRSESEAAESYFMLANGHGVINQHMNERGVPLRMLPFVGAVYVTNTGENDSGIRMGGWQGRRHTLMKLWTARPLTKRIRSEMSLYDLC